MKIEMPANVKLILNILSNEGYQAYAYGACIRDSLLGTKPINWELATNALPSDNILLFDERNGFSAVPVVHDYSTVVLIYQGESYRLGTFRTGEKNRFADSVESELKLQDFTINAIAYNDKDGFIDPFGGIGDIEKKIIKCTGDPLTSLKQDHVRILRAVRFEAQLGFSIDPSLLEAIDSLQDYLQFDNSEKVCNELTQILLTEKPSVSIRRLLELDLLQHIIPEIIPTIGFDTHSSFHDKDVFEHTMVVMDESKPNLSLRLAALLHDIDKPNCLSIDEMGEGHCYGHAAGSSDIARKVLARLNFDHKTINAVGAIIKEHMNNYESASELSIKRLIRRVGIDNICDLFELQLADIKGSGRSGRDINWIKAIRTRCWEIMSRREPLTTHDLDISGYDLMGICDSGKEMREAYEYLLDRVLDNPSLNNKADLLALLKAR